eukprot:TRINITY_DN882_c0_g1_i1.p1 TRINITY_DN882_c0_g1~~TRINITY_DN882_c0_g1_i1.p1  ORF type:complete len:103 (-),score=34.66 TRINITY_DN882_c0_g1_i1:301-609(-)
MPEPFKCLTAEEVERYTNAFTSMDKDGNKTIDREEAKIYMKNMSRAMLGNPPDGDEWAKRLDAEVDQMFATMDENHDQVISLEEYLDCHASVKQRNLDKNGA